MHIFCNDLHYSYTHFPGNQAEGISRGGMEEKGEAEGKRGSGVWEEAEEVGDMYCLPLFSALQAL